MENQLPKFITTLEMLAQVVNEAIKLEQRTALLEMESRVLKAKIETITSNSGHYTIKAFARLNGIHLPNVRAKAMGKECSRLCRERGFEITKARDETFGEVNIYPESVIAEVMQQYGKN
jgi:hypothetical protein